MASKWRSHEASTPSAAIPPLHPLASSRLLAMSTEKGSSVVESCWIGKVWRTATLRGDWARSVRMNQTWASGSSASSVGATML